MSFTTVFLAFKSLIARQCKKDGKIKCLLSWLLLFIIQKEWQRQKQQRKGNY